MTSRKQRIIKQNVGQRNDEKRAISRCWNITLANLSGVFTFRLNKGVLNAEPWPPCDGEMSYRTLVYELQSYGIINLACAPPMWVSWLRPKKNIGMKWVNVFGFCHTIIKMTIMMTINIILLTFFLKALKDFEVFIIKIAVILTFCVPVLSLQELQIVSITVLQVGYYQFLTFVLIY